MPSGALMNTAALREQILRAHQHETATGQLVRRLEVQLPHLHPAIHLPQVDAQGVLTRFVCAYIELETRQHTLGIHLRKMDGRMQMRQLYFQSSDKLTCGGFVLMGTQNLLAQSGGVHEGS